jgi:homoserine kinase type II
MAVFTPVSEAALKTFLQAYSLGEPVDFKGIEGGIENTNYFLDTWAGASCPVQKWVLTLFENLPEASLPFFMELVGQLAKAGFSVPAPLVRNDGSSIGLISGKSAVIVPRLPGKPELIPSVEHCAKVGEWLASFHLQSLKLSLHRPQPRSQTWFRQNQQLLAPAIPEADNGLITALLDEFAASKQIIDRCPSAVIHGDLFRDNVLFLDDQIAGVIDFYNAATDSLLHDVAIAMNDWAVNRDGSYGKDGKGRPIGYDQERVTAMLDAYQSIRPWSAVEQQCWPLIQKRAALSFWMSRLISHHQKGYQTSSVVGDAAKNPDDMKAIIYFVDH